MNDTLYAAGDFILSDGASTWHVAKWTGAQWKNIGAGIRGAGLWSLTNYNNQLYAGGFIDTLSGWNPGLGVLKWDGTAWVSLGGYAYGVSGTNGFKVNAMVAYNGELYVGGIFQKAGDGSIVANNIAKWNGTSWSALGTGANGEVRCFTVLGTDLYMGGDFTSVNGVPANRIAKYNGSTWSAVGAGFDTTVFALGSYRNKLYASGIFEKSATDSMHHIARWDGISLWTRVWSGIGYPGINLAGYALTQNDNNLYAGGYFTVAGTTNALNITRIYVSTVYINELASEGSASVYPNPTKGILNIEWAENYLKELILEIYSVDGKLVATRKEENPVEKSLLWDVTYLPKGFYLLKSIADGAAGSRKLIIE